MKYVSLLAGLFASASAFSATYPPNIDYGSQGDFIAKRGVEFGRTADLTPIGPILVNYPEAPGSSDVGLPNGVQYKDSAWDLSDLTNPTMIRTLYCDTCGSQQPIAAHATVIRFDPQLGALLWNGGDYFRYDPNGATSNDQLVPANDLMLWDTSPWSYSMMFAPYHLRTYWLYGFDSSGLMAIRDPSQGWYEPTPEVAEQLGETESGGTLVGPPLVMWDHLGTTGVTGFSSWLGNLLVVASDQQSTGLAIYDTSGFKDGIPPRLLSHYDPQLETPPAPNKPADHRIGIGGYWAEPYGTNKMVWASREAQELTGRFHPSMYVVDFTDPTNPQLTCELYFNVNQNDTTAEGAADGDWSSDPMYVNFQDEYAFVDHFKVNIPACEQAYAADQHISEAEFAEIVYKFNDIENNCDSSQYFRPLGQVGIFGGYDFGPTPDINEQGMCFFVTSDEPDTRPPFVSGHRPLDGQTNYPIDGFIHVHIPETLRSETLVSAITVTNLNTNQPINFQHQWSHTGTISIWPDTDLAINTTYLVELSGIQDFMGNTMVPYSFTFSTGDGIVEPPPPPPPPEPAPDYDGVAFYPNQSSQLACEPEVQNGNVWAVNPDNDSVTIIDREMTADTKILSLNMTREIKLNYEAPTSIAKIQDMFAVTYRDDDKVVMLNGDGYPVRAIDTGHGTQPVAVVADGVYLYVALYASSEVVKIHASSGEIVARLDVGATPKAMALHGDRLLVTRFISPTTHGEIYDIDTAGAMTLVRTIVANKVLVPDDINHGSGVPNYLSSIVVNADGTRAYVTANKANIDRGLQRNGQALDDDNTVRPMIITLDLVNNRDANVDPTTRDGSIDLDNGADPSAVTFLANPAIRVQALQGNNVVVAVDSSTSNVGQFNTQAAPQSMCSTLRTLYVKNFAERSVTAIDVAEFMHDGSLNPTMQHVATVTEEILSAEEKEGLKVFYHSKIPEMGPEGYMSCATCHSGGGHDGMVWDITSLGEGLRNTLSLNGSSGTRFGNLHWSANFDEVQDFEIQMEHLNGGDGLIPGDTFTGQSPLEYTSAGRSQALDALAAYINGLGKDRVKRSPYRSYTGELTAAALRGKQLFDNDNCADCHSGQAFRDGLRHDVGTITTASGQRLNGVFDAVRTPTLIELWDSAPYFHDGSAATLQEVLQRGDHARNLSAADEADFIAYLYSIDREMYIDDAEPVNQPPIAVNDSATTDQNQALVIATATLLQNDSDPENDALTFVSVSDPANGTAVLQGSDVTYTPNTDFTGTDSFHYVISDGQRTASGQVDITVSAIMPNRAPIALDDQVTTTQDTAVVIQIDSLLSNDSDPDGDPLTLLFIDDWINGTAHHDASAGIITFTPTPGFVGQGQFTYIINDGNDPNNWDNLGFATVVITIEAASAPGTPVGGSDSFEGEQNVALTMTFAELLANDSDPDNDPLDISAVTTHAGGIAILNSESDNIVFDPGFGFTGIAAFSYTLTDGVNNTLVRVEIDIAAYATLTVNNGSGDGRYRSGTVVDLVADAAPSGEVFASWSGDIANVADVLAAQTTITVGDTDVSVSANFAPESGDDQAPSVPTGLTQIGVTTSSVSLSWQASTDTVAVTGYQVLVDGSPAVTVSTPSATVSGLNAGTSYQVQVQARDAAGNWSALSSALSMTTDVASDAINVYMAVHSLGLHTTSDETTVPHWLALLSSEGGTDFSMDGRFGQIDTQVAAGIPTESVFGGVGAAQDGWNTTFADSNFDAVIITTANWIQGISVHSHPGAEPNGPSTVEYTLDFYDILTNPVDGAPGIQVYIYEHWPEWFNLTAEFPPTNPTQAQFDEYNNYTLAGFHQWWYDLQDAVNAARPNAHTKLIPVGPVVAKLITGNGPLVGLTAADLFEDSAGHGHPTMYFLAAMVHYMVLYEEPVPTSFVVPESVHPLLRNNFATVVNTMWQDMQTYTYDNGDSRIW